MQKLLSLLAPALILTACQAAPQFKKVTKKNLPPSVSRELVNEAIVRILTVNLERGAQDLLIEDIGPTLNQAVPRPSKIRDINMNLRQWQIYNCHQQKIRMCPMFQGIYAGTGFFVDDGKTLVTALHLFEAWYAYVQKYNPGMDLSRLSPPAVVMDAQRRKVLHDMDEPPLFVSTLSPKTNIFVIARSPRDNPLVQDDLIELQFKKPAVSRFFTRNTAAEVSSSSETFYCLGFPSMKTYDSEWKPTKRNRDEMPFSITAGAYEGSDDNVLHFSCLASQGMSGGPIVNEDGVAVGVINTGFQFHGQHMSTGALTLNKKTLETSWKN